MSTPTVSAPPQASWWDVIRKFNEATSPVTGAKVIAQRTGESVSGAASSVKETVTGWIPDGEGFYRVLKYGAVGALGLLFVVLGIVVLIASTRTSRNVVKNVTRKG